IGERSLRVAPPSSPARSGCSQYSTPSSASCGSASSASSSDHHSLTSTMSGRSGTPRTPRTRSTSRPSPPPSFPFHPPNRPRAPPELALQAPKALRGLLGPACHALRLTEPDRPGGRRAAARQPEQAMSRKPQQLALQVVQRRIESRLRRLLAGNRAEALTDVLERERIVADESGVLLHELECRLHRLLVALDRRSLAVAGDAFVGDRDMHDIREVGGLPGDGERLRQLEADDRSRDLHGATLAAGARDGDDVGHHVGALMAVDEAGRHDPAALLHPGRRRRRVDPGIDESRSDSSPAASLAMTARALALED